MMWNCIKLYWLIYYIKTFLEISRFFFVISALLWFNKIIFLFYFSPSFLLLWYFTCVCYVVQVIHLFLLTVVCCFDTSFIFFEFFDELFSTFQLFNFFWDFFFSLFSLLSRRFLFLHGQHGVSKSFTFCLLKTFLGRY